MNTAAHRPDCQGLGCLLPGWPVPAFGAAYLTAMVATAGLLKVYDVVLGRSEAALEAYLTRLEGKDEVRLASMDLATVCRSLARKYFPHAQIVADRFHVIRLINHHFLACWKGLDPVASKKSV